MQLINVNKEYKDMKLLEQKLPVGNTRIKSYNKLIMHYFTSDEIKIIKDFTKDTEL